MDTFGTGTLARLRVTGNIVDSQVRVGINPRDGIYDNGNDQIAPGGGIQELIVGGALQGNTLLQSPVFPSAVKVGGVTVTPLSLPQVRNAPLDSVAPTVALALLSDTGSVSNDRVTTDTRVTGVVTDAGTIAHPNGLPTRSTQEPKARVFRSLCRSVITVVIVLDFKLRRAQGGCYEICQDLGPGSSCMDRHSLRARRCPAALENGGSAKRVGHRP